MGTINGTVAAEMEPSIRNIADLVQRQCGSGENLYRN